MEEEANGCHGKGTEQKLRGPCVAGEQPSEK